MFALWHTGDSQNSGGLEQAVPGVRVQHETCQLPSGGEEIEIKLMLR